MRRWKDKTERLRSAAGVFVLAAVLCGGILAYHPLMAGAETVSRRLEAGFFDSRPVILLDPGHGGVDGGAVGPDGICEKDINLSICQRIRRQLEPYEIRVEMTRETDCGLYGEEKRSIRQKKAEDLRARLALAEKLQPAAMVSIHLNSYRQDRTVSGAQTFYTTSCEKPEAERSRILAEKIQSLLIGYIDNGNNRAAMEKNDVLIMKSAKVPTVIVECGFLSNYDEASRLQEEGYQELLAQAVAHGILDFLGIEKKQAQAPDIKILLSE